MGERIRHYSVYYNNKRVAWFKGKSYEIKSGDEAQIADNGYMGHSDGATQTMLKTDMVVPVKGIGISLESDLLNKKYVKIGVGVVNGKAHQVEMRMVSTSFSTDESTGALTGEINFEGGPPTVIG